MGLLHQILPPILTDAFRKMKPEQKIGPPAWHTVYGGTLTGYELLVNPAFGTFSDMLNGQYESYLWEFLSNQNLAGADMIDIGGHIGYETLAFAKLVGETGRVYAFEPNPANVERLQQNIDRNPTHTKNVKVYPYAVGETDETLKFTFSSDIESGMSSGGFIDGSFHPLRERAYQKLNFIEQEVAAKKLDTFFIPEEIENIKVIKIDVEGAEHLVLRGAIEIIKKYQPCLLIEVHTIMAMQQCCEVLYPLNYKFDLLDDSHHHTCIYAAYPAIIDA